MADITVPVPDDRVAEFYQFFGTWLAGASKSVPPAGQPVGSSGEDLSHWGQTDDDRALAQGIWDKLSDPAKAMFELLIETQGKPLSGEEIAEKLQIEKGKYGVAGVLAWPGRYCAAVGRHLPVHYKDGPVGGSASYWMYPDVAVLFSQAAAA